KIIGLILVGIVTIGAFVGCGSSEEKKEKNELVKVEETEKKDNVPVDSVSKDGESLVEIQDSTKYRPLKRYNYYKDRVDQEKNSNLEPNNILRYIDEYKGLAVEINVLVEQVVEEDGYQIILGSRPYEGDMFAFKYVREEGKDGNPKVLKGDNITVLGTILDEFKYKTVEGVDENIPLVEMNYVLGHEYMKAQSIAYEYLSYMSGQLGTLEYVGTENQFPDLKGMSGSHVFALSMAGERESRDEYIVVEKNGELLEFYPLGEDGLTKNGDKKNFVKVDNY
ncbi:MAG: hypothetical protein ACRC30_00750, partial [Clostridium sp.]